MQRLQSCSQRLRTDQLLQRHVRHRKFDVSSQDAHTCAVHQSAVAVVHDTIGGHACAAPTNVLKTIACAPTASTALCLSYVAVLVFTLRVEVPLLRMRICNGHNCGAVSHAAATVFAAFVHVAISSRSLASRTCSAVSDSPFMLVRHLRDHIFVRPV